MLSVLVAKSQTFPTNNKSWKNLVIVQDSRRDTLFIYDTIKHDTLKRYFQYIRSARFINDKGLILARISDGEGLLNSKGKMLMGPCNIGHTKNFRENLIYSGPVWGGSTTFIFSSEGDSLFSFQYFSPTYVDTMEMMGINLKTKRTERGIFTSDGKWIPRFFLSKSKVWITANSDEEYNDKQYKSLLITGDKNYKEGKYEKAMEDYAYAIGYKPSNKYSNDQWIKCKTIINYSKLEKLFSQEIKTDRVTAYNQSSKKGNYLMIDNHKIFIDSTKKQNLTLDQVGEFADLIRDTSIFKGGIRYSCNEPEVSYILYNKNKVVGYILFSYRCQHLDSYPALSFALKNAKPNPYPNMVCPLELNENGMMKYYNWYNNSGLMRH
ncbi:hypothetical protein BH10BAC1_BH10BAC1_05480 [soil metagenome]